MVLNTYAKQPTLRETGPRVYSVECRYINGHRCFMVPQIAKWHDRGDRLEFDGLEYPGDWEYIEPGFYDGTDGCFYRRVCGKAEWLSMSELEQLHGLPW